MDAERRSVREMMRRKKEDGGDMSAGEALRARLVQLIQDAGLSRPALPKGIHKKQRRHKKQRKKQLARAGGKGKAKRGRTAS